MPHKNCVKCFCPFKGFGDACSTCRVLGSAGALTACSSCGGFFQGYGSQCWDCQERSPACSPSPVCSVVSRGLPAAVPRAQVHFESCDGTSSMSSDLSEGFSGTSSMGTSSMGTSSMSGSQLLSMGPKASVRVKHMAPSSADDAYSGLFHRRSRRTPGEQKSRRAKSGPRV